VIETLPSESPNEKAHLIPICYQIAIQLLWNHLLFLKNPLQPGLSLAYLFRHTSERGYLIFSWSYWIPADAGMTESESPEENTSVKTVVASS